jgi:hypothetical protein
MRVKKRGKLKIPLKFDEAVGDLLKVKPRKKEPKKAKRKIKPADGLAG